MQKKLLFLLCLIGVCPCSAMQQPPQSPVFVANIYTLLERVYNDSVNNTINNRFMSPEQKRASFFQISYLSQNTSSTIQDESPETAHRFKGISIIALGNAYTNLRQSLDSTLNYTGTGSLTAISHEAERASNSIKYIDPILSENFAVLKAQADIALSQR